MTNRVENNMVELGGLAKVVADLEARLKELESRLEESELRASKERDANKELEDELLMYKKEFVEQHLKRFNKAVVEFFVKDLDLGLFDPFKDVKNSILLDEKDIAVKEEASEEQDAKEQGDDANV